MDNKLVWSMVHVELGAAEASRPGDFYHAFVESILQNGNLRVQPKVQIT